MVGIAIEAGGITGMGVAGVTVRAGVANTGVVGIGTVGIEAGVGVATRIGIEVG